MTWPEATFYSITAIAIAGGFSNVLKGFWPERKCKCEEHDDE